MTTPTSSRPSARERLLAAASELFYAEGVHSVGIDRVIERAGVAKATLYGSFGSKDALVRAYLERRHEATRAHMSGELAARYCTAAEKLVGVFEVQSLSFSEPGFRGCAFVGACAEAQPGSSVGPATDEYRAWVQSLFLDLAIEAGAREPELLAQQLKLLFDGAGIGAWMDRDPGVAIAARTVAAALVAAATD